MIKVVIIGAGGHAMVVADILLNMKKMGDQLDIVGFLDDDCTKHGQFILGFPVLGTVNGIQNFEHDTCVVAIGNNRTRFEMVQSLKNKGESFFSAIHPCACIGNQVELGQGVMVCAGAVINSGSSIGNHVILNTGCTVDHHNQIGDFVHVAPGVHSGGDVSVGEGTLLGIGSTILPGNYVGVWSVIGGGSVVTKPVDANTIACGYPARAIKKVTHHEATVS
jgi:sugar O-acyltransferase (sialic acid O-acetyltransferase NeuD family)